MNKVLHVLPMNKMSGAERMALLLCKNLKNYKPVVVCGGVELSNVFKENGIRSYNIKFSNKNILFNACNLSKIIKNENIKIVHAHDNTASLVSYLAKKIFRCDVKIISHIHSCYPFLKFNSINKRIDSILRPKYDYNIACGKLVYNFYNENSGYFLRNKAKVLSNAIDIDEIININIDDSNSAINEFNIPKDKTILGFVGRICDIKGIIPFINEIANHKNEFMDCKVLLIGSGDQEDEVRSIIRNLKLEDIFILTGFQENVYKFYPLIDVFFLPSRYEGLPMVILEAMAFNKPVLSMNVGSISEVIDDGKTGYLVKLGNYNDFIIKLREMKSEKRLMKKLGENAFNYINRNYNIKVYIQNIENIYNNQIGKENNYGQVDNNIYAHI